MRLSLVNIWTLMATALPCNLVKVFSDKVIMEKVVSLGLVARIPQMFAQQALSITQYNL